MHPQKNDLYTHKCTRCSAEWTGRTEHPAQCAKCHSIGWNKPVGVKQPRKLHQIVEYFLPIPDKIMIDFPYGGPKSTYVRFVNGLWYRLRDIAGEKSMQKYSEALGTRKWHEETPEYLEATAQVLTDFIKEVQVAKMCKDN
jgi:hypothetical protein